ncbi:MAG: PilZ domain-containing protein [Pseudomonadota bacterium]|nr:PilZ domain-containing protein [Pseudomonadota bacterium]
MVNVNRDNRRFSRVTVDNSLRVEMNSVGSDIKYMMETKDISDTGFFLDFEHPGRFPFTPMSIMEIWLELEAENKIFFNGKMTRVVFPDANTRPGIAIRIVQIDSGAETTLREFIKKTVLSNEAQQSSATANIAAADSVGNASAQETAKPKQTRKKASRKKSVSKKASRKKTNAA